MLGDAAAPVTPVATERCGNFECNRFVTRAEAAGVCGACRLTLYCSKDCQRADWKAGHKTRCGEVQRNNAKVAATLPRLTYVLPPFAPTLAAAVAGDAAAQYDVAVAYLTGTGVTQSFASVIEWWKRCAAQPHRPREVWTQLGRCYQHGHGVAKDFEEAVRLYRLGAQDGSASARTYLADCLLRGLGVPEPDVNEAFALLTTAAAQDHPEAILDLGISVYMGRGVVRDPPRAMELYKRALTHPRSQQSIRASAACYLGMMCVSGDGVPREPALAARYLRQAAALGDETAARLLCETGLCGGGDAACLPPHSAAQADGAGV